MVKENRGRCKGNRFSRFALRASLWPWAQLRLWTGSEPVPCGCTVGAAAAIPPHHRKVRDGWGTRAFLPGRTGHRARAKTRAGALISFAEGDFEGVYGLAVADAFELAVELGGGVGVFFFVLGFGLALFDGVVKVGLGEGLERDEGEAEGGGGGREAAVIFIGGFFSAELEAPEEKYGGEEREKGEEGTANDEVDVHGSPLVAGGSQAWIGAPDGRRRCFRLQGDQACAGGGRWKRVDLTWWFGATTWCLGGW